MTAVNFDISKFLDRLFPLERSIMGESNRKTLSIIREIIPIEILEYPSGMSVFDWNIPDEWKVYQAWIKDSNGNILLNGKDNSLRIVNYSIPVNCTLTALELAPHLHSIPDAPDTIPYKTSYYSPDWGFCLTHIEKESILYDPGKTFSVCIQSEFKKGSLSIGELVIPGKHDSEILISTYICHPSLANDNLSGIALTTFLAKWLLGKSRNFTYRIIFAPETIGTITYLFTHFNEIKRVLCGLNVTCVAGPGPFGYKQTFQKDHTIDRAVRLYFRDSGTSFVEYPFIPQGSDERQYSSPGFRIPVGSIHKDKYHEYPQYHTSKDDLSFISPQSLEKTLKIYQNVIEIIESNAVITSLQPFGEPQLGRRGLYPNVGRRTISNKLHKDDFEKELDTLLWVLFYADGTMHTIDIAEITGIPFERCAAAIDKLVQAGLLKKELYIPDAPVIMF